jgi:hypothetical protein
MQRRALQYGKSNQLHLPKDAVCPPLKITEFVGQDLAELAGILATSAASTGRTLGTESLVETDLERLLDAESYLLTHEILADPRFRQTARKILQQETIMVSTTATARGIFEVDSSHPLRPVMKIKDKLFQAFTVSTEFTLIRKSESKWYTAMSIQFPSEQEIQQNRFIVSAATVSVTTNSPLIEQWNLESKKVATAVFNDLIPLPIGEAVQNLAN